MYRTPKEARTAARAAKSAAKLNLRAVNARAAAAIADAQGWAGALAPVLAALPPTVKRAVNAWADAADERRSANAALQEAFANGDDEDAPALAETSIIADARTTACREDVRQLGKDARLTASVVAAAISEGMVAPAALRRQLGSAMLCRTMAQEVEQAKSELTAALDAQAQAVKALRAAK